ncbi:MAG: ribonuclease HII [Bacteroidetes bacterium]|nr:MAG: ribonuclease HII [Bacteroidota bacterium]
MLLPYYTNQYVEAGLDEVGRGCLAGPVVASAVILPKHIDLPTLRDSKQLTAQVREELGEIIKEKAIAWAIAECSPVEIDKWNILNASIYAMHRALASLPTLPELLLVDGNKFKPYDYIPYYCIVKGDDKYLSIAAASVLAKNYRDALMVGLAKEYPEYGWETNMGYPTKAHKKAIASFGLTPHHRLTFKST